LIMFFMMQHFSSTTTRYTQRRMFSFGWVIQSRLCVLSSLYLMRGQVSLLLMTTISRLTHLWSFQWCRCVWHILFLLVFPSWAWFRAVILVPHIGLI
jgi:hypothetical protein